MIKFWKLWIVGPTFVHIEVSLHLFLENKIEKEIFLLYLLSFVVFCLIKKGVKWSAD